MGERLLRSGGVHVFRIDEDRNSCARRSFQWINSGLQGNGFIELGFMFIIAFFYF